MPATQNRLTVTVLSDLEIELTRTFDAPRDLVFKVMNDPNLLPQWWGPRNMTTRVDACDFRVGGRYRYVHLGPEGEEYGFRGEFREIAPPERVSYTFEFEPMEGHICLETVNFEDLGDKTRVRVVDRFDSIEDRDGMLNSGMESGAAESYDRLEELLATYL